MFRFLVFVTICLYIQVGFAGTIQGQMTTHAGATVGDAVIYFVGTANKNRQSSTAIMAQKHQQFDPYVLPIRMGSRVKFPNLDSVRHHIYSFSKAKRFEVKLYGNDTSPEITFNKPGEVVIGCNIHDWMLAYIYVVDTPYFTKSKQNGRWQISLPNGDYTVKYWHPRLKNKTIKGEKITIKSQNENLNFELNLKPDTRKKAPSTFNSDDYDYDE